MERSAGIILFRGNRKYLLLKHSYKLSFWTFCKGKIEDNESEEKTALREAEEETGLSDIKLVDKFKEKTSFYKTVGGKQVFKEVVWFLGEVLSGEAKVSKEHEEVVWVSYDKAVEMLKYEGELLKKAEEFLRDHLI